MDTFQAPDRSLMVEQPDYWTYLHSPALARKVDIYFPDVLPELRGRDGTVTHTRVSMNNNVTLAPWLQSMYHMTTCG